MSAETSLKLPSSRAPQRNPELQQFLPPQVRASLAPFDHVDSTVDLVAQVKFVAPQIPSWALYVAAFDGEDTLFGLWASFYEVKLGYFSLSELQTAYHHLDIEVQRDEQFEPMALQALAHFHAANLQSSVSIQT